MEYKKYTPEQATAADHNWLGQQYNNAIQQDNFLSARITHGSYNLTTTKPSISSPFDVPIAQCSNNGRYHEHSNATGALKYDPVSHAKILDPNACQALRVKRGSRTVSFEFNPILFPKCTQYNRKVLAVPSIGCPILLQNSDVVAKLLWAVEAKNRPTVLVVHSSEAAFYYEKLENILDKHGVGLIEWRCHEPVLGFGVSRLAAQHSASFLGERRDVVLCDVNVIASKKVASGYHTDNEGTYPVRSTMRYTAAGKASGVPMYTFGNGQLYSTEAKQGGKTRPIEQVVTVNNKMFYDPCFITSSEDADLTKAFLFEEGLMRKRNTLTEVTFKGTADIEKLDIGYNTCSIYTDLRNEYLNTLRHEDKVIINYNKSSLTRTMTVGDLANEIVNSVQIGQNVTLDPVIIRSLIIEKILLEFKSEYIYSSNTTQNSGF